MKAYKLTSNNRYLTNFFEGLAIDEEKGLLWSEQDLGSIGGEELNWLELHDKGLYKHPEHPVFIYKLADALRLIYTMFYVLLKNPVVYAIALPFVYLSLRLMGIRLRLTPWTIT